VCGVCIGGWQAWVALLPAYYTSASTHVQLTWSVNGTGPNTVGASFGGGEDDRWLLQVDGAQATGGAQQQRFTPATASEGVLGAWTHIAVSVRLRTGNSSDCFLYRDGVLVAQQNAARFDTRQFMQVR
jgi:hypothetical protein